MTERNNIGMKMKGLRKEYRISLSQIALYLSTDEDIVERYENGEESPNSTVIDSLCCLYGMELGNFISNNSDLPHTIAPKQLYMLSTADIKDLSAINRIALNQIEMDRILNERVYRNLEFPLKRQKQ